MDICENYCTINVKIHLKYTYLVYSMLVNKCVHYYLDTQFMKQVCSQHQTTGKHSEQEKQVETSV